MPICSKNMGVFVCVCVSVVRLWIYWRAKRKYGTAFTFLGKKCWSREIFDLVLTKSKHNNPKNIRNPTLETKFHSNLIKNSQDILFWTESSVAWTEAFWPVGIS